ncbi:bifunctional diguanylate cyclase/phosphodiesterase [Rhodoferax aquaticus]|uniref:EAL domain-containing protein n=1 Tax=Rhodoferax aquaticus TaxID=2527691 RepID=A0A515EPI1_9BURK|nr:EAL domain-containing protein [Rhodoferax aquaticus]QDL54573.1 EAL domain-containing protein [Rhodoferax aquaticus]
MTLRNQLLVVISALFLAVLTSILLVSVNGTRAYLEQQLSSHAQDAATTLSVTLGLSLGKGDTVLAETQVASLFDRGYFKRVDVLGADKKPLITSVLPEKIEGVPEWFVRVFPINTPPGEAFIGSGWKQLGKVVVQSQPTFAYQHLWSTCVELVAWLVAISLGALALVQLVLHYILMPLRAIEKTAIDVQAKRFAAITLIPRAPELARVVTAMNQMSKRVGEMLEAETARAEALHTQAYLDETTGLANRRGFEVRLADLLHGQHQFELGAVVAIELDDMRLMNRAHGFAAGEHIVRTLAQQAQATFSKVPLSILARSNEFSFSFVLADLTHAQVTELATDLRKRLLAALESFEPVQMVAINTGVAFFTQKDQRSDVFAKADFAVESARQSDRNGFVVMPDSAEDSPTLGSFAWRTLIQSALVENRWRMLSQPVLSLAAPQTVLQAECMARLVDAQGELVPAANFMPMAARHRLMPEVDKAMVTLALAHIASRGEAVGLVAVNLSPQSLGNADFIDWFAKQLSGLGVNAKRLAVEVSEFGALRNMVATLRLRDLVRNHGGQFGIDHFGLDPQAFKLLREVLPDYVKLTGALMAELEAVESVSEMLQSFVQLAHSLDVMVIAQQVERSEQVAVLTSAKVDAAQGYFFGAPQ